MGFGTCGVLLGFWCASGVAVRARQGRLRRPACPARSSPGPAGLRNWSSLPPCRAAPGRRPGGCGGGEAAAPGRDRQARAPDGGKAAEPVYTRPRRGALSCCLSGAGAAIPLRYQGVSHFSSLKLRRYIPSVRICGSAVWPVGVGGSAVGMSYDPAVMVAAGRDPKGELWIGTVPRGGGCERVGGGGRTPRCSGSRSVPLGSSFRL